MIHTPKKNTLLNFTIVLICFVILATTVFLADIGVLPDSVWQCTFFVLAIVLSEIMIKFFLPTYTYIFDEESFKIVKTLGKKTVTVCHIDREKIAKLYTREEYKKQEDYRISALYNYSGNLKVSSSYVLVFVYSTTAEAVIFEPSCEMAEAISSSLAV